MKLPLTAPALTTGLGLAALLLLAGCASGETAPPSGDGPAPDADAPPAGVCDTLSADEVGSALGIATGDGAPRTGEASVNGVEWTTTGCGWEGDGVEVVASVALADDFPAGFACVAPGSLAGDVTPLDGLGTHAWWTWDDFQGGTGTVIVCGADTRVEVVVEGPREGPPIDEAATREGATTLAETLHDSL